MARLDEQHEHLLTPDVEGKQPGDEASDAGDLGKRARPWRQMVLARKRGGMVAVTVCWLLFLSLGSALMQVLWGVHTTKRTEEIPNIVHFVWANPVGANGTQTPLSFDFRHFLAIYSAHFYMRPDAINIWTDASAAAIDDARRSSNVYTRAISSLATVVYHTTPMPSTTSKGVRIEKYQHKSDFVRTRIMRDHGGLYLDDDAWLIKDLGPLRRSGYENVFGRQVDGKLCQATWLSRPGNAFMKTWVDLMDSEFNGEWTKAGNELISKLYPAFVAAGARGHALVLERDAFFPFSWVLPDLKTMYGLHDEADIRDDSPPPSALDVFHGGHRGPGWTTDWSATYSIHGWTTGINDQDAWHIFGPYRTLTPEYVLAHRSNVARALYPAVKDAIDSGVLTLGA